VSIRWLLAAAVGAWAAFAPAPSQLKQFQSDGVTEILPGGTVTGTSVKLQAKLGNGSTTGQQKLRVEVKPVAQPFTNTITAESAVEPDGTVVTLDVPSLAPGDYKWQAWAWCT